MTQDPRKSMSIEDRLAMLETETDAQLTALRLGIAVLMASSFPVDAKVYLKAQAVESTPPLGKSDLWRQAFYDELGELSVMLADVLEFPKVSLRK